MVAAERMWEHAVVAMMWTGLVMGVAEGALLLCVYLRACIAHRTCRTSKLFSVVLAARLDDEASSTTCVDDDIGADTSSRVLLRRLASVEAQQRRQGVVRRADFFATLRARLEHQRQSVVLQASRYDEEEQQLIIDAKRANWALARVERARYEGSTTGTAHGSFAELDEASAPELQPARSSEDDVQAQTWFMLAALGTAWVLAVVVTGLVSAAGA